MRRIAVSAACLVIAGAAAACSSDETTTFSDGGATPSEGGDIASGGAISATGGGGGVVGASGGASSGGASSGGASSGGASSGGASSGGGPGCPPECDGANDCVTACGETPRSYGCCPCPPNTVNVLSCGDPGTGVSCDQRDVRCRAATPLCDEGSVPSVRDTCWGPCVPIDWCVCSGPEFCPNEETYTCHNSAGRCGPYLL